MGVRNGHCQDDLSIPEQLLQILISKIDGAGLLITSKRFTQFKATLVKDHFQLSRLDV